MLYKYRTLKQLEAAFRQHQSIIDNPNARRKDREYSKLQIQAIKEELSKRCT